MKIVFGNDIIENSTKSIYKKDKFENLFLKIIDLLNIYQDFHNLNKCEKLVKQLINDFSEKIKRLKNFNDIYNLVDILFNEKVILKPRIIGVMNKYCFTIEKEIKKLIYVG